MTEQPFYIGYVARAPGVIARRMTLITVLLVLFAAGLAILLASAQQTFADSSFEYGKLRSFTGVVMEAPVPMLIHGTEAWLLGGSGKHAARIAGLHGRTADIRGSAIRHGRDRMVEVHDFSQQTRSDVLPVEVPIGRITLTGEIVDSKCYFGVMNPGAGKVHRDCAVRCISGGLPAALLVRDAKGAATTLVLTGVRPADLLPLVAERVSVTGRAFRIADRLILETITSSIVRTRE